MWIIYLGARFYGSVLSCTKVSYPKGYVHGGYNLIRLMVKRVKICPTKTMFLRLLLQREALETNQRSNRLPYKTIKLNFHGHRLS